MENFFYDENFCSDLSDLMEVFDIKEPKELKDGWTCKVELTELEPIFKINAEKLCQLLCDCNEERLGEDFDNRDEERVIKAIKESCDFDKLKELLPKYYYPRSNFKVVTKQDLIDYCK